MATTTTPESNPVESLNTGRGVFGALKNWWQGNPVLVSQLRGFAVVAIICTVISMTIFASLRPMTGTQWANVISLVLCSILNTELNRRISFGLNGRHLWWRDQRRGLWVMLLALAMTSGSLWVLHQVSPNASIVVELAVIVLGNVASAVTRFLLLRYWIFRRVRHAGARQPHEASAQSVP
ncbi:GtrA family protein [Specibacter sp. AOP5-B1-6]|uniref:GtrA family protein n=1 Tax=Specibacter sp. AOP5-B1-6 TaxID=3457653 RepID=UPI00402B6483